MVFIPLCLVTHIQIHSVPFNTTFEETIKYCVELMYIYMIPCSSERFRVKRFIDATYTFDGKTVRSLDAKQPVEMNTANGTCYTIVTVIQNENFPLSTPQRHVGGGRGTAPLHLKLGTIE
jgi:hypothetical protein